MGRNGRSCLSALVRSSVDNSCRKDNQEISGDSLRSSRLWEHTPMSIYRCYFLCHPSRILGMGCLCRGKRFCVHDEMWGRRYRPCPVLIFCELTCLLHSHYCPQSCCMRLKFQSITDLCASGSERWQCQVCTTCALRGEAMDLQLPVYTVSHYSTPEDLP
jgi:hypothetical protein